MVLDDRVTITTHHNRNRDDTFLIYMEREPIEMHTYFNHGDRVECDFDLENSRPRIVIFKSNTSRKTIRLPDRENKYKIGYRVGDKSGDYVPDIFISRHPKQAEYHKDCIILYL